MVRLFVLSRYLFALVIRQKAVLLPANDELKIEEKIGNFCSAPPDRNRQKSATCTAAGVKILKKK